VLLREEPSRKDYRGAVSSNAANSAIGISGTRLPSICSSPVLTSGPIGLYPAPRGSPSAWYQCKVPVAERTPRSVTRRRNKWNAFYRIIDTVRFIEELIPSLTSLLEVLGAAA
jgi:hypothetical protein